MRGQTAVITHNFWCTTLDQIRYPDPSDFAKLRIPKILNQRALSGDYFNIELSSDLARSMK